jgi:ribosomal-protein-alanine N-acetyltransferase
LAVETIETERLILRGFTRSDSADVFAYGCDPNVSRFTSWKTHQTIADSDAFIEMVLARGLGEYTWAIRQKSEPRVIGAIEFGLKPSGVEAQIDYVLAQPFWNRGFMTEAARAVVALGLNRHPTVQRVVSQAMTENVGSRRVMEKCGFRFERTDLHRWSKTSEPVELCRYVLARSEAKL